MAQVGKCKPYARKKGFSLVGMLVSLVLVGISVRAFLHFTAYVFRAEAHVTRKLELDNVSLLVTYLLSEPENCLEYFGGREFRSHSSLLPNVKLGSSKPFLAVHMPRSPANVVVTPGHWIGAGRLIVESLRLHAFTPSSSDNYLATLELIAKPWVEKSPARKPRHEEMPIKKTFPINLTTETVKGTSGAGERKVITGCSLPVPKPKTVGGGQTIAKHAFSTTPPACPAGSNTLWTGYSFVGWSGSDDIMATNLSGSGSCLEQFRPATAVECEIVSGNSRQCTLNSDYDRSIWLVSAIGMDNSKTYSGIPSTMEPLIGRCSVCQMEAPLVVRHSLSATKPDCPLDWAPLWRGFSFGGVRYKDDHQTSSESLSGPGSCLEEFEAVPFIQCQAESCNYETTSDRGYWLSSFSLDSKLTLQDSSFYPLSENLVSQCVVCTPKK